MTLGSSMREISDLQFEENLLKSKKNGFRVGA
jgi:hypothetical protein